jgi:hypothetical protein
VITHATHLPEGLEAVVVLEQRVVPEAGDARAGGGAAPARRLRVVPEVPFEEVERDLVLGEAHLYDAARVGGGVVGVLVVGFPPGEVRGVLAVEAGGGHLRQGRRRLVAGIEQQLATHGLCLHLAHTTLFGRSDGARQVNSQCSGSSRNEQTGQGGLSKAVMIQPGVRGYI